MVENNPHFISANSTGTLGQITDGIDYPHTGLIKSLSQMARGNIVVKNNSNDFDITQASSGNVIQVSAGSYFRDGKLYTASAANFTTSAFTTTYDKGYHMLVVNSSNALAIRQPTANDRVPAYTAGDTIIALIEYTSATAYGSRLIQFLTTDKTENSINIGYNNSGVYTTTSEITGASGVTTITAASSTDVKVKLAGTATSDTFEVIDSAAQVQFKVQGDGEVSTEGLLHSGGNIKVGGNVIQASDGGSTITLDTSDNVTIGGGLTTTTTATVGTDLTVTGGDINLGNGQDGTLNVNALGAGSNARNLTITSGNVTAGSGTANRTGGDLTLSSGAGSGTGTSSMVFKTAIAGSSGTSATTPAERMRIHTDGNVGIGTNAPESNLHIAATASGAPILTLDNTAAISSSANEPQLIFKRSGATASSGDLGGVVFKGMNDAGTPALFEFGRLFMDMVDETAGTEDGRMIINIAKNGQAASSSSATEMLRLSGPYGFQFNYNNEDHNFEVRGANNNNVLTVDASTDRVGIGVAEPSSALEIQDGLTTTGAVLTLSTKEPSVVANDVLGKINFQAPLDTGLDSDLVSASIHAEAQDTFSDTVNQTSIVFSTGASETATEKARITSGGKLGIGESVPDAPLHVKYSGTGDGIILESTEAGSSGAPDLTLLRSSSSPADNDTIGNIKFNGIDDDDDEETFVSIVGQMADITDATIDGRLKIFIKENGSSGNHVLEMSEGTLGLEERAAVGELQSNGSYGRIWIKNDNPNNLYFTNGDDNNIQLTNGATGPLLTGKHSIWVPAAAMYANTTNGCSALTQVELSNGPELKVLDFAADADDFAQFTIAFPKSWNEGTVTFQPYWTVTGTNTGTVVWGMSAVAFADNADQNTTFGSIALSAAKAHSGTSNDINVSAESAALTIKSAAVDTLTYFQIFNDTSASGQTGVARLTGVKILYTVNTGNDE